MVRQRKLLRSDEILPGRGVVCVFGLRVLDPCGSVFETWRLFFFTLMVFLKVCDGAVFLVSRVVFDVSWWFSLWCLFIGCLAVW